ncbi:fatty-acyl elongase, putative [Perkinsus marinus ATCC 50983]|uniref:Elongation of fatty acids protein n=1 Tax=Perkinsus marinus (strain ATCC 50983 / TXsc) TaxID=423536 RepID=C5K7Q4_PERM5|nr:fatty-acyl elongase, putative [Perkinsus marinus ATCC 50983]EER19589.1 fatty-acyl elongase, putative [Perkinsus marinus ATCC 50983]|eukprot:XP_002787793.1 fatty-acyl elongase, putative [Perkinsus marinus ATCC 50983]
MMNFPADNLMQDDRVNHWNDIWMKPSILDTTLYGFKDLTYQDVTPAWLTNILFPTDLENWSPEKMKFTTQIMREYWWASWVVVAFYLLGILVGQRMMKNRQTLKLKKPLAMWNLFLAVFSFIGVTRTLPLLLAGTWYNGPLYFVCRNASDSYGRGPCGLWISLFMYSKYVELVDTAFLVLRKRNVNFLHWFHHATVLLYCWHAGAYEQPTGIFFATMNYMVHSIMYFYYFLSSVGHKPRWGLTVTILQISQMFAGMFVVAVHYYSISHVPNCDGAYEDLVVAFLMYTAYMLLFVQFFVGRYMAPKKVGNTKKSD